MRDRIKVTRDGRIYHKRLKRYLNPRSDGRGYLCVNIDGKTYKAHRVVCEVTHGPKPSKHHLPMHRDNDKTNNRPRNIYWGTRSENLKHAHESGAMKSTKARKVQLHIKMTLNGEHWIWANGDIFESVNQAARLFKLSPGTIASAASGKSKTAAGYKWSYA